MIGRDNSRPILQRLTAAAGLLLVSALVLAGCQSAPATGATTTQGAAAKVEGAVTQALTQTEAAMTKAMTDTTTETTTGTMTETRPITETSAAATHSLTTTHTTTETASGTVGEVVMLHQNAKLGELLADGKGMTLYVFNKDTPGKSNCTGECLVKWPPLAVKDATALKPGTGITAKLATITRDDGKLQVTANGLPLYYYYQDKQAGDTTGQAVGDVWWVVGADGNKITAR